jgi:hypothetical protein
MTSCVFSCQWKSFKRPQVQHSFSSTIVRLQKRMTNELIGIEIRLRPEPMHVRGAENSFNFEEYRCRKSELFC